MITMFLIVTVFLICNCIEECVKIKNECRPKYLLITVSGQEISTKQFSLWHKAFSAMQREMVDLGGVPPRTFANDECRIEDVCGFDKWSGFSNIAPDGCKYAWRIIEADPKSEDKTKRE